MNKLFVIESFARQLFPNIALIPFRSAIHPLCKVYLFSRDKYFNTRSKFLLRFARIVRQKKERDRDREKSQYFTVKTQVDTTSETCLNGERFRRSASYHYLFKHEHVAHSISSAIIADLCDQHSLPRLVFPCRWNQFISP